MYVCRMRGMKKKMVMVRKREEADGKEGGRVRECLVVIHFDGLKKHIMRITIMSI